VCVVYVCPSRSKIAKLFLSVRSTQFPFKFNILFKKEYSNLLGPKILVCATLSLWNSHCLNMAKSMAEKTQLGVIIKIMIHSLYCRPSSESHSDSPPAHFSLKPSWELFVPHYLKHFTCLLMSMETSSRIFSKRKFFLILVSRNRKFACSMQILLSQVFLCGKSHRIHVLTVCTVRLILIVSTRYIHPSLEIYRPS